MPGGLLTTWPLALPLEVACTTTLTLSAKPEIELKLAVTVVAPLINTVQLAAVPVHPPPLHPANVEPLAAVAVSTTDAPLL